MKTSLERAAGFTVIEALLLLIIISIVGFTGYYVRHIAQNTNKTLATRSAAQIISPYRGWKSASMEYEKIRYKYPGNWAIKAESTAQPEDQEGCVYPGNDAVTLTSPSNEQVVLATGISCIGDGGSIAFGSVPIHSLGQNLYLAFENDAVEDDTPTAPAYACLAKTATPDTPLDFSSKNIFLKDVEGSPVNYFCYYPYNQTATSNIKSATSVDMIKNSKDFNTAKLIFESMHY